MSRTLWCALHFRDLKARGGTIDPAQLGIVIA